MIDSSAKYGLYNPAFTDDIGQMMLAKMHGNKIEDMDDFRISGTNFGFGNIDIQKNLSNDKFESTSKKQKIIEGVGIGIGILAAVLIGRKLKIGDKLQKLLSKIPGVSKISAKISSAYSSIKTKIKVPGFASVKGFFTGIKSKFSGLGSRIRNIFK